MQYKSGNKAVTTRPTTYFCISLIRFPFAADSPMNDINIEMHQIYSHQSGVGTCSSSISNMNISKRSKMSADNLISIRKNSKKWKNMQYLRRDLFSALQIKNGKKKRTIFSLLNSFQLWIIENAHTQREREIKRKKERFRKKRHIHGQYTPI